jgi:ABC-2 type transport system permease protein
MAAPVAGLRLKPCWKYGSLFMAALHRALAYRQTTALSVITSLIWVVIPYFLWRAVFEASPEVGSFDWERMRTYLVVAYGVNMLLTFRVEARILNTIRTGEVATELMRPIHYLGAQMAEASGAALVDGLLTLPAVVVLGAIVLQIQPSATPLTFLLFLVSVALGFLVKFMISYITSLLCFWTLNAIGLIWARTAVSNIFSGALIPLEFLPPVVQTLARWSPFQAIVHTPLAIYFGDLQDSALIAALGVQVIWIVLLWGLAHILWRPSIRTLTVQGG